MREIALFGRLENGQLTQRPLSRIEFSPLDPWGTWYETTITDAVITASWQVWAVQH